MRERTVSHFVEILMVAAVRAANIELCCLRTHVLDTTHISLPPAVKHLTE